MINVNAVTPEIRSPASSLMPKLRAADVPTIDHTKGITKTHSDILLSTSKSIPRVKIVVGQGSPNVGEYGYA